MLLLPNVDVSVSILVRFRFSYDAEINIGLVQHEVVSCGVLDTDGERGMATHPTARCRMSKPSCSEATGLQSSRGGSQPLLASCGGPRRRLAAAHGVSWRRLAVARGGV